MQGADASVVRDNRRIIASRFGASVYMSRLLRFGLTLVLAGALAASVLPSAHAHTNDRQQQIEREKAELKQKIQQADRQAKTLSAQIAASDARKAALERDIASYTRQIAEDELRLEELEGALDAARGDLLSVEGSLAASLSRLDTMKINLDARVRDTYKSGPEGIFGWVLTSQNLRQFVSRVAYLRSVMEENRSRVDAVEKLSKQLAEARVRAVEHKDSIEIQKSEVETQRAHIEELRASLRGARLAVVAEISNRQGLLKKVEGDKAEYLRQVARLEAESKTITALLKARQRGQVFQAGSGTRLAWPTTGSVSSGFGYRTHPIFGDRRFHSGIDISAPSGQTVIASEAGEILFAGYRGGYGLSVIIDHGNALATLYAHMSSVTVSSGSRVGRGARVGAVGCSGYCTGPHLHFETRINGDPVDPMQFF